MVCAEVVIGQLCGVALFLPLFKTFFMFLDVLPACKSAPYACLVSLEPQTPGTGVTDLNSWCGCSNLVLWKTC